MRGLEEDVDELLTLDVVTQKHLHESPTDHSKARRTAVILTGHYYCPVTCAFFGRIMGSKATDGSDSPTKWCNQSL
ncbi:MAG: hypothetical protein AB1700_03480 [Bacillota bacterium]